jgi:hypothetical protein
MKFILLLILFSSQLMAYTFNNNFGASFKDNDVKVMIAGDTTCLNAGLEFYELEDLIGPAIDKFWNRVPTSALRLSFGGYTDTINNINDGRLCAPTDETCINSAPSNTVAPVEEIVIACNDFSANFGGSTNVLAVTIPNNFAGKSIKGSVILINNLAGSIFANLSKSDQIGVIAHEIGHAIGLGHTDDKAAMMYYRTVDLRRALGEDDMRGVSYLYPMKLDGFGLLGGCATIEENKKQPPSGGSFLTMLAGLFLMVFVWELKRLLKRSQARPTL